MRDTACIAVTVQAFPHDGRVCKTMQQVFDASRRVMRTLEAATYCGSSASTFEKLRLTGGGPAYSKIGRRVVYRVEDLDAWLAANRRRSTSDPGGG